MVAENPESIFTRITAAEQRGDFNLASQLREHLVTNYPDSAQAKELAQLPPPNVQLVRVIDFDVPFVSLVRFLIKVAIAAIPAAIIISAGVAIVAGVMS